MPQATCSCKDEKKPYVSAAKWLRETNPNSNLYNTVNVAQIKDKVKISVELLGVDKDNKGTVQKVKVKIFNNNDVTEKLDESKSLATEEIEIKENKGIYGGESKEITIKDEWNFSALKILVLGSDNSSLCKNRFDGRTLEIRMDYAELKIGVIDCRSGKPVKNAKVKKIIIKAGDKELVEEFQRVPFSQPPPKYFSDINKVIPKNSMAVLKALNLFKNDTSFRNVPENYKNEDNFDWITKYNDYWKKRSPVPELKEKEDQKYLLLMKLMCKHFDGHSITDDKGFLTIYIPKLWLDYNEVTLEVGFYDFPVALERVFGGSNSAVLRQNKLWYITPLKYLSARKIDGTGFDIRWNTQKKSQEYENNELKWGTSSGWEIHQGTEKSELKVSEKISIKNDKSKFNDFNNRILSPFYNPYNAMEPHFVLIAMEWCQPVWDGISEPDAENRSYVQDERFSNLNMHLPTVAIGASSKNYGKYEYKSDSTMGIYRKRLGGHKGIDIHADVGDNLFAVHGGEINKIPDPSNTTSAGNKINLVFRAVNNDFTMGYLHLSEFVNSANNYVMAGQLIGHAGRTGVFPNSSAGHVHLNLGGSFDFPFDSRMRRLLSSLFIKNLNVIPCNDFPLLFPCACIFGGTYDSSSCMIDGNNTTRFATNCWAINELACPRLNNDRNRKIQAQLKFLGYYRQLTPPVETPVIDGQWGAKPVNASSNISKTRNAIYKFKSSNGLLTTIPNQTFVPDNYDMLDSDVQTLNQAVQNRMNIN